MKQNVIVELVEARYPVDTAPNSALSTLHIGTVKGRTEKSRARFVKIVFLVNVLPKPRLLRGCRHLQKASKLQLKSQTQLPADVTYGESLRYKEIAAESVRQRLNDSMKVYDGHIKKVCGALIWLWLGEEMFFMQPHYCDICTELQVRQYRTKRSLHHLMDRRKRSLQYRMDGGFSDGVLIQCKFKIVAWFGENFQLLKSIPANEHAYYKQNIRAYRSLFMHHVSTDQACTMPTEPLCNQIKLSKTYGIRLEYNIYMDNLIPRWEGNKPPGKKYCAQNTMYLILVIIKASNESRTIYIVDRTVLGDKEIGLIGHFSLITFSQSFLRTISSSSLK